MSAPTENSSQPAVCVVCGTPARLHRRLRVPVWCCPACGTRFLREVPQPATVTLDEHARIEALAPLRRDNARRVLTRLMGLLGPGRRLLDVGCAHGWFVLEAQHAGFDAEGIDPDGQAIAHALALGAPVRQGAFPHDVGAGGFDVVTFNDVFEHLPAPHDVLAHCLRVLAPGGVLVLNLPSRHGLLYRLAELLAACGVHAPLERLYQLQFPSPHLHYFGAAGIHALADASGLRVLARQRLPVVAWRGLLARLRMDTGATPARRWLDAALLALLLPVLRLWPRGDIEVYYLGRGAEVP
jgi:SAM-dependent methyltransferase